MKKRIHIILLALLICLIPMNYGCSVIKVALKPAAKGTFKTSFAKVSKYTGKYGKYVFGKSAKIIAKPSAEIKRLTVEICERSKNRSTLLLQQSLLLKQAVKIRKIMKPNNQFLINKKLDPSKLKNQILGQPKDANILHKNMVANGCDARWIDSEMEALKDIGKRSQTHHVVPPTTECMNIFKKFGIDINDCRNGIYLPQNKYCFTKGSLHGTNTSEYKNFIFNKIKDCKSQSEVFAKLDEIKTGLYNGEINILSPDKHVFIN